MKQRSTPQSIALIWGEGKGRYHLSGPFVPSPVQPKQSYCHAQPMITRTVMRCVVGLIPTLDEENNQVKSRLGSLEA